MNNKKKNNKKQGKIGILIICALLIGTTFGYIGMYNLGQNNNVDIVDNILDNIIPEPDDKVNIEKVWQVIATIPAVGENDPGVDTGGFMSIWWYDYTCNPVADLADNTTDWSTNTSSHGYEDADATTTDTKSENLSYIVVRAQFNALQAKDGANWNGTRCRATLTCSGDETISQTIQGNNSAETYGGGIESDNNSAYTHIYINFYFDDNTDGYRITDDGSVTWAVTIEGKW